jgi:hypothetical protein
MIGDLPCGYQYDLVLVSQIKRLLQDDMPIDLRARLLELIAKRARGVITMEAVAAIQPAPHAAMAMLDEMKNLSIEDKEKVMRRRDVFEAHISLNPSIMEAISLCRDHNIFDVKAELTTFAEIFTQPN